MVLSVILFLQCTESTKFVLIILRIHILSSILNSLLSLNKMITPEVHKRLMIAATVMSVIGTGMFLLACSASNSDPTTLQDVPWVYAKSKGPGGEKEFFFGTTGTASVTRGVVTVYKYKDCQTQTAICQTCYSVGEDAMSLMACAVFFAFITIITSTMRISEENDRAKKVGIVCYSLALCFSVVAVGIFNSCYDTIYASYSTSTPGIAYIFLFFGILLIALALCLLNLLPIALDILSPPRKTKARPDSLAVHRSRASTKPHNNKQVNFVHSPTGSNIYNSDLSAVERGQAPTVYKTSIAVNSVAPKSNSSQRTDSIML